MCQLLGHVGQFRSGPCWARLQDEDGPEGRAVHVSVNAEPERSGYRLVAERRAWLNKHPSAISSLALCIFFTAALLADACSEDIRKPTC